MPSIRHRLTISEAASLLGVSRQRFHQLIGLYQLKTEPVHSRLSLIKPGELKKLPKHYRDRLDKA